MSAPSFYLGLAGLALLFASVAFIADRLRIRLLPAWEGAMAVLGVLLIAFGYLIAFSELLGLFGQLKLWSLLAVSLALALAIWLWLGPPPRARRAEPGPPALPVPAWGKLISLAAIFVVVAIWASFTSYSLDFGITNFDSVWYHLPFSAEIAQSASVTTFQRPETVFLNWFYPQNSELLHAIAMIFTGRDFVSVFINLGWLAVGLLAGWCLGRPYGRSHLTLLAVAALLSLNALVAREPGSAKNDIVAIAMAVSSLAVLVNLAAVASGGRGRLQPGWGLAVAALAAGLAAGTKVTVLAPVALITVAVIFAAESGRRLRVAGIWVAAGLLGGGYWYLKNLVASGNPLPQVENLGPIPLPGPERLQVGRPDFTVFHYLADGSIWRDWFLPGLQHGFGDLWPLLIAAALAGGLLSCWYGENRLLRGLGTAAILAALAYLITPLTAAGAEGMPTGFAINLRFLVPALAMGLLLLPLLPVFGRSRAAAALAAGLSLLLLADGRLDAILTQSGRRFGLAFALLAVIVPVAFYVLRPRLAGSRRGRLLWPVSLAGLVVLVAAILMPLQHHYFDSRYADFEPEAGLAGPYRLAGALSGARIALAGTTAGFKQYGFYGAKLDNRVRYMGRPDAAGGFRAIADCPAFKLAVNADDPDLLVTSPYLNFREYSRPIDSPETVWVSNDPAARAVESGHGVTVWRIHGRLDPALCRRLPPGHDYTPGLRTP